MKKILRDTEPLPIVIKLLPDASFEEQMEASATLWRIFDVAWSIAERQVIERHKAEEALNATG